ncbi:MAG TPA: DUF2905 domain-containing protein [Candidatus Limnocylindrales bacterium]
MESLEPVGRTLLAVGVVLVVVGVFLIAAPRIPFLGRLPGDVTISRDGLTVFIPLGTMLVLSVVASVLLGLLGSGRR